MQKKSLFILIAILVCSFKSPKRSFTLECDALIAICKSENFQEHFQIANSSEPLFIYQNKSHIRCESCEDTISNRRLIITDIDMKTRDQIDIVLQHSIENLTEFVLLRKPSNLTAQIILKKDNRGFKIYKVYYGVF
jgi:hypothetical protein